MATELKESSLKIPETPVTIDWLADILRKAHNVPNSKVIKWSSARIGQGQGFLSHIVKVSIEWDSKEGDIPEKIVLKVPTFQTLDGIVEEMAPELEMPQDWLPVVHEIECNFYKLWLEQPAPGKIPRCYEARAFSPGISGILVFEDLSERGMVNVLADSLNLKQILSITENLASFHAWSLTNDGWQEKFPLPDKKMMESWPQFVTHMLRALKNDYPETFGENVDKVVDCGIDTVDDYYYAFELAQRMGIKPVLTHGDLWSSNMLFEKVYDENGKAKCGDNVLAFIDWQIAHPGTPAEDLLRLLCSSVSAQIRRAHFDQIMRHYYDSLLSKLADDTAVPFTYDTLIEAYHKGYKMGMLMGVAPVAMMTKQKELLGEGDHEKKLQECLDRAKYLIDDALPYIQK